MSTFFGVVAPSTRTSFVIQTRSGRQQYFIMLIRTPQAGCAHCVARICNTNTDLSNRPPSLVRGIVKVVTAVANGDLKQNLTVKSMGEVAALAETSNNMTDTLAIFADQVTSVAREVNVRILACAFKEDQLREIAKEILVEIDLPPEVIKHSAKRRA